MPRGLERDVRRRIDPHAMTLDDVVLRYQMVEQRVECFRTTCDAEKLLALHDEVHRAYQRITDDMR